MSFGLWRTTSFGMIFILILLLWIFVFGISSSQPGAFFNKGHNAVWIGHEWVSDAKSDSEVQTLVNNFIKYQIDTVFVHTGPLQTDGTIEPKTYEYAMNFLEQARKFNKDIQYQAWMGQIRSKLDLSKPEIRHNVAKQAMIMAQFVDFDGVHLDIEPVWDGDLEFIKLLKESRDMLPEGKKMSVALAEMIPESFLWLTSNVHTFENYNSEVNYKNVAKYADQIIVMTYDTGVNNSLFYKWLVQEQTIRATSLLDGTEVFIGIPAYDEAKDGFNPEVENVENGLNGIIQGLNNLRSDEENFAGVAIYPYWKIDENEWKVYENTWLK